MLILTRGSICAFWDPALHQTAVQNRCPHSSSSCPVVRAACGQGGPRKAAHGGRCCGSPEELHLLVGFFLCASGSGPTFFFFFCLSRFFFHFFSCSPFMCSFFLLQASDPAQKMGVSLSAPGKSNKGNAGKE